jgi:anti-sigma factor ChrR (cupin superfamily)
MTQDHNDGLAAEYVLGTLAGDERRRFAAALARDPELQALVDDWEQRLQGLEQGRTTVEPSAGLWDKIEAALGNAPSDEAVGLTIRSGEGEWQEILDGIEKKVLFFDAAARSESFLLRFAPGARLPSHKHRSAEECVVLEGTFMIGDLKLEPGDFQAFEGDTIHPETYCAHGGLVYVRGELREAAG